MHSAPSVSYPVGRSRFAAALLLLAWLLGAVVTAWWAFQSASPGWRVWGACFILVAAGAFAAWNWWHSAQGVLAWDGETWSWTDRRSVHTGALEVGIDLQHWLLLRWTCGAASHWLWLGRTGFPERWDDVRRAVYSRAGPEPLPEARAPAAKP